jgi:hypothetical protein
MNTGKVHKEMKSLELIELKKKRLHKEWRRVQKVRQIPEEIISITAMENAILRVRGLL